MDLVGDSKPHRGNVWVSEDQRCSEDRIKTTLIDKTIMSSVMQCPSHVRSVFSTQGRGKQTSPVRRCQTQCKAGKREVSINCSTAFCSSRRSCKILHSSLQAIQSIQEKSQQLLRVHCGKFGLRNNYTSELCRSQQYGSRSDPRLQL